jgi:hypothetical protein
MIVQEWSDDCARVCLTCLKPDEPTSTMTTPNILISFSILSKVHIQIHLLFPQRALGPDPRRDVGAYRRLEKDVTVRSLNQKVTTTTVWG